MQNVLSHEPKIYNVGTKSFIVAAIFLLVCMGKLLAQPALPGRVVQLDSVTPLRAEPALSYHIQRGKTPPLIDGNADDWAGVAGITLNDKEHSAGVWNGPDDLSGTLRMMWDDSALYYLVEIKDDTFAAPDSGFRAWNNDGFQLVFDTLLNGPQGHYDADDLNFLGTLTPKGPSLVQFRTRGMTSITYHEAPEHTLRIRRETAVGGNTVYEGRLPWSLLAPLSPSILGRCGFSFTLLDNDGAGFKGGQQWTKGIFYGEDASQFGELVFDGDTGAAAPVIELRPESRLVDNQSNEGRLTLSGIKPFDTATVLARPGSDGQASATVKVFRAGGKRAVRSASLSTKVAPGKLAAFTWDLSTLPNGIYEIVYSKPGQTTASPRLSYYRINLDRVQQNRAALRSKFGIDRPWDQLLQAPPSVRRHRGLVALGLDWMANGLPPYSANPLTEDDLGQALLDFANMTSTLEAGRDYLAKRRGRFWCAYYSQADGSGQPFLVEVPLSYDPAKKYPLLVRLHGGDWLPRSEPHPSLKEVGLRENCLAVEPWGRGFNGYTGLGEQDVHAIIEFMKRYYNVDPTRVSVTGASMGGVGSWRFASRYPYLFSAAAPLSGYTSNLTLENLYNTRVFNQHGAQDWGVAVDQSRYAVSRLHQMGYPVIHKEYPDLGHDIGLGGIPAEEWALLQRREPRPRKITLVVQTESMGKADWVQVLQLDDPHRQGRVEATVSGSAAAPQLQLELYNIAALALDVSQMPLKPGSRFKIHLKNQVLTPASGLSPVQRLFLVRKDKGFQLTAGWQPAPETAIRPYRNGAAANLYAGEPLMVVYGTRGSAEQSAMLHRAADVLSTATTRGSTIIGRFPVKADKNVSEEDLQHFNLILLGSERDNALVARMAPQLPVHINERNEVVAGERTPVSLEGGGLRFFYYNPLAPRRLIFWLSADATSATGKQVEAWLSSSYYLTGMAGDNRPDQADLIVQGLDGALRRCMQFTYGWKWRQVAGADQAAPAQISTRKGFTLATLKVVLDKVGGDLALGWTAGATEPIYAPRWFTLADQATSTTPGETLKAEVSGEELIDIYNRWVAKEDMAAFPSFTPQQIQPNKMYSVAMEPSLLRRLAMRQKNLRSFTPGPRWEQEELWAVIFGPSPH